jgi:AcrR family transcriptional regulator
VVETSNPSLAERLQSKRAEMMTSEIERVALRLFEDRGFSKVTVEEIASQSDVSQRTFFRYFRSKENVLQVRVDHRAMALGEALAARPVSEPPLESVREALVEVLANEDIDLLRRWAGVVTANPDLLQGVLGGIQLKVQTVVAEFFAARLGSTPDALDVSVVAAAVSGMLQAASRNWAFEGGDLTEKISAGIDVLERFSTVTGNGDAAFDAARRAN